MTVSRHPHDGYRDASTIMRHDCPARMLSDLAQPSHDSMVCTVKFSATRSVLVEKPSIEA
jgi:hypothetical protein